MKTKYEIAKEIEMVSAQLGYDGWSLYRQMTFHFDYFKKDELQYTLDKLVLAWWRNKTE